MIVTQRIKKCLRRCFIIAMFAILFFVGGTVTRASADSDFVIENRVLVSYTGTAEEVIIPEGVTTIGNNAFAYNMTIKKLVLPESLLYIEKRAFDCCENLEEIVMPYGIMSIGDYAFAECRSLKEIEVPGSVTYVGEGAFKSCESLAEITLPLDEVEIGAYAFGSTAITIIELPKDLEVLTDGLFANCKNLVDITIPDSVQYIGSRVFEYCSSLKELRIPADVISMSFPCFTGCEDLIIYVSPDSAAEEVLKNEGLQYGEDYLYHEVRDVMLAGVLEGQQYEIGNAVTFVVSSETKLTDAYLMFDRPEAWTAENGAVYFAEETCRDFFSVDLNSYETVDGLYVYYRTIVLNTEGNAADEYRRRVKLAYKYEGGETAYTDEIEFIVTPVVEPEKPLGEASVSTAWKGTDGRLNNELYCGVGSSVTLQISVTGVAENQSFEVAVYDAYNNLVRKIDNSSFSATGGTVESSILSSAQKFTFNKPGTQVYMVKLIAGGEAKAASRSAILYVRNEDSISIEQRNRLESFKGVRVADFVVGNSMVVGNDNGLVVEGVTYYKYTYDNPYRGLAFFVNAEDKTLVTDHEILRKLLYLDASRSFLLDNAQNITGLNESLPAILEGIKKYEKGRVASQFTGAVGNAILTGGTGFASALGTIAWSEVSDINTYMEIVVLLKFYDYCAFFEELSEVVEGELGGTQTDISHYEKVDEYIRTLFYIKNNYSATFELLKKVSGVPDSKNAVANWCKTYGDYMGAALETMSLGLSTVALEFLEGIGDSIEESLSLLDVLDKACQPYLDNPVRVKSEGDISDLLVDSTNAIIDGDIFIGQAMEVLDLKENIENIIMFVQWCSAIRQTDVELIDYNQGMSAKIERVIETYGLVKATLPDFEKPMIKPLAKLPESVIVNEGYILEFEVNGIVTDIQTLSNADAAWRYGDGESGNRILVELRVREEGTQRIKLSFCNEQDGYAEWSTQVFACKLVETGNNYKISYNERQNLNDSTEKMDTSKTQNAILKRTEIVEGHGGDDTLVPLYKGQTTYYLYYLDENDGHDTIIDNGGGDYVCLIGKNADVSKVTVRQQEKGWDISYGGKIVVSFECDGVASKPIYVIVAKSVFFSDTLFGGTTCELTDASKLELKTPKYLAEAKCPVDILVLDKDGEVVQTLKNGQQSAEFTEYGMFMVSYDEAGGGYLKQVYLYDDSYTVKVVGNGEGTMKYRFTRANDDGSIETYYQEDIEITKDIVIDVDLANPASLTDSRGNVIAVEQKEVLQCSFEEPETITEVTDIDVEEPGQDKPSDDESKDGESADGSKDDSGDMPVVSENSGIPGYVWIIAIGIAVVVATAVLLIVIKNKKKEV